MKIISYILSALFGLVFFVILLIFHPIQWVCFNVFGYKAHKLSVDVLNWFLVKSLLILGVPVRFNKNYELPENETIIFVSNHQSMFDIPPIIWYLRKHHPKFVSKIELGKGIPSISYNLRQGGAALIDRKDRVQAIKELNAFAKRIHDNKWSAVIFPEGTRSRNGEPKPFSTGGLKTIITHNPEAYVVPITVNNSWKIFKYGKFPLGIFSPLTLEVHEPIHLKNKNVDQVLTTVEEQIKSKINVNTKH
ncbi:lysophospholipid acyltransferase family protein [Tenacibaculum sp. IB213877]|uniref:lysophospholipid acyltransferase family protein n=1 Tax=Tenacibaculum sp. IB213877 TaxID=3097351 RepID=UPI002A5A19D8|nr:lysophospholipid acyltransferase family protein [Tenacibaculum sp. IB213877]MDY0781327.1 lysophospholipid acyltransferase family protein [Tenacibaculum sp. IB213877]